MMRRSVLAVAALAFTAPVATGETLSSLESCQVTLDLARETLARHSPVSLPDRAEMIGGWCSLRDLRLESETRYQPSFTVDRLRWRGEAIAEALQAGSAPPALEIELEGFRVLNQVGDPAMDYMFQAQSRAASSGIDAQLAVRVDTEARAVEIERLSIDMPGENSLFLSATAEGLDLSSESAAQLTLLSAGVTSLNLEVESNGLFEVYVLPALTAELFAGAEDPDARAEELRAEAKNLVLSVPLAILDTTSRAELVRLIDDLPNPTGKTGLAVSAEPGLGAARFLRFAPLGRPPTPAEVFEALDGTKVDVTYAP